MSHILAGIMGAAAMSVAFGAVQLASGSSLNGAPSTIAANAQSDSVNRAIKADRVTTVSQPSATRTISLNLAGLNDTSVLVRIPAKTPVKASGSDLRHTLSPQEARRAATFACEPVVSALTEVAKLLAPGRCVT